MPHASTDCRARFVGRTLALCCLSLIAGAAEPTAPGELYGSAIASWHFADLAGGGGRHPLTSAGAATVGVALTGDEREQSLRVGGDGMVARIDGGHLDAGQGSDGALNLSSPTLTFAIRLRSPSGIWGGPLFSKHDGHDKLVFNLFSTKDAIGFELGTQGTPKVTQVKVPVLRIGARDWHVIVCRYDGAKLQMFIDGVWLDEGFPMGALRTGNKAPVVIAAEAVGAAIKSGWKGEIDHAALWDRALSDAEIAQLSGGAQQVAKRKAAYVGALPSLQYWKPQDPFNVGDTLPMFHEGVFHFYYLLDRGHHQAKNGRGAHQWAHASSTDLIHWQDHPLAVPITDAAEGSICTGAVFANGGTFNAFYATRGVDGQERLSLAVSNDGVRFTKTLPNPFLSPGPRYTGGFRDPFVFRAENNGMFHLIVSTTLKADRRSCLAQYVSSDLKEWKEVEPLLIEEHREVPECPDYFAWNGWYYLLFSYGQVARYRMSKSPLGPWITPPVEIIDGAEARVMKTAAFTGNRRIGTVSVWPHGYAGWAVFRELVQHADGTLGSRFVPEMEPKGGAPIVPRFTPLDDGASGDGRAVVLAAKTGASSAALSGIPANARIRLRLAGDGGAITLALRAAASGAPASEIRILPSEKRIAVTTGPELTGVAGLDQPFTINLVLTGRLLDLCVNQQRTLVNWTGDATGDWLKLTVDKGALRCDQIEIIPLP